MGSPHALKWGMRLLVHCDAFQPELGKMRISLYLGPGHEHAGNRASEDSKEGESTDHQDDRGCLASPLRSESQPPPRRDSAGSCVSAGTSGLGQLVGLDPANQQDDCQDHRCDQQYDSGDCADEKERGQYGEKRHDQAGGEVNTSQVRVAGHGKERKLPLGPAHPPKGVIGGPR